MGVPAILGPHLVRNRVAWRRPVLARSQARMGVVALRPIAVTRRPTIRAVHFSEPSPLRFKPQPRLPLAADDAHGGLPPQEGALAPLRRGFLWPTIRSVRLCEPLRPIACRARWVDPPSSTNAAGPTRSRFWRRCQAAGCASARDKSNPR